MNSRFCACGNRKKLESHARVDFSEGCKSIVFSKVLGRVFPPWPGFLPKYQIFVKPRGISPHFMKMGWFYAIVTSVGRKWCFGGPGAQTQAKPMLFLCFFRGPGQEKCVPGWISTQSTVSGAILLEFTKMGEIPRNSTTFTKFPHLGVPRGSEPRKGLEFTCIITGFARHAGDRRKHWIHMFYRNFIEFHSNLWFYIIFLHFNELSRKHI